MARCKSYSCIRNKTLAYFIANGISIKEKENIMHFSFKAVFLSKNMN